MKIIFVCTGNTCRSPDPYGAPAEVYEQTYHKIYDLVKKMKTTRD